MTDPLAGPSRQPLLLASIVACAFFMETLDSTVIVTALPMMGASFGRSPVDLSLGLTAYMLALAVFIPASGWVSDRFGAGRIFCGAIGLFTLASVLCGLSDNLWQFVAARMLQGIGGAMMSPVGRLVLLRGTEKRDLVRAINFLTVPGLIGPVLGPPVGGFITTYASWRWIFFLNVPIGLLGVALVAWFIRSPPSDERRPFDRLGFLLNGTAVAGLIYGMDLIGKSGADWIVGALLVSGAFAVGTVALRHTARRPHPLFDLTALKVKTYAAINWGGMIYRTSLAAPTFLMPLLFQVGLGMSAFASGLLILSHTAGDLVVKAVTTRTLRRFGFRSVLIWSAVLYALFIATCGLFTPATPQLVILVLLFISGAFRSLQMTAQTSLQFADIPAAQMTGASTLSSIVQQVVRAVGVAFAAILLNLAVAFRGTSGLALADFRVAFVVTALVGLTSILWYLRLDRYAAAEVSGHGRPAAAVPGDAAERE